MGIAGIAATAWRLELPVAILLVMISGFFNSPSSVARSVLLQRNTPREMRGRVFSAFYVMRDIIFLFGMAGRRPRRHRRHPAAHRRRLVPAVRVGGASTLVAPGLGHLARWRAAAARLQRPRSGAPGLAAIAGPAATLADFDRLVGRLPPFGRLRRGAARRRSSRDATVREVPAGTRIVEHGDTASSAYFILDGSATAGIPDEGGYRGLSTMGAGDFFGEIAALTGSPRTADVVADTDTTLLEVPADALRATMVVPEIRKLVLSTLTVAADRGPRPPTCRASPASTRRRCATCARRGRASRRCPRSSTGEPARDRCLAADSSRGQRGLRARRRQGVQSAQRHIDRRRTGRDGHR